jgi:hypothetical protein
VGKTGIEDLLLGSPGNKTLALITPLPVNCEAMLKVDPLLLLSDPPLTIRIAFFIVFFT